jgi:uncharacterized membrane protein YbhN (UPF0104 family)
MLVDVAVIVVCAALAVAGVVCVVRWGADVPARAFSVRRLALLVPAGILAGVLVAGAAGRLVMRLLALTSPDSHGWRCWPSPRSPSSRA